MPKNLQVRFRPAAHTVVALPAIALPEAGTLRTEKQPEPKNANENPNRPRSCAENTNSTEFGGRCSHPVYALFFGKAAVAVNLPAHQKRTIMSLFWKAYLFFFIVIFPMIMYYPMTGYEMRSPGRDLTNPYLAVGYLFLALLLWIALMVWYYKRNIRSIFSYRAQAQRLMETGKLIEAEIISKTIVRRIEGAEAVDLHVKLINLSGTAVETTIEDIVVPDGQESHGSGGRILLRLDPELREPCILPDGMEFKYNKWVILSQYLAFAAIIVFFAGYLVFSYKFQSHGDGWRFLTFFHPLITIPLSAFFYPMLILGVKKMFLRGAVSEEANFLLYGKKASATIPPSSTD